MTALTEKEIQTIPNFFDRDRILLSVVLEDKLLEVQECPLMRDLLAHLDKCFPSVFGSELCAIRALPVLDKVFDLEGLLKNSICENLEHFISP